MVAPLRPEPRDPATGMVPMTVAQFLEWEEAQELKYECVDGFVRAMTGARAVEVTSPSTRPTDRGQKRDDYRETRSLRSYIVVEQAVRRLDCWTRGGDGSWAALEVSDVTAAVEVAVPCVDLVLTLDEIYADTDIGPPAADLPARSATEDPPPA